MTNVIKNIVSVLVSWSAPRGLARLLDDNLIVTGKQ